MSHAAVRPLLAVLCACARAGAPSALAVVKEPGLLAAVSSMLDPAAALSADLHTVATLAPEEMEGGGGAAGLENLTQQQNEDGSAASVARAVGEAGLQASALQVLRLLCQASATTANLVRSSGALAPLQAYIALADGSGGGPGAQLLRLEALRAWRACAHHGIALMSMDDVFPHVCKLLPPPPTTPTPGGEGGSASSNDSPVERLACAEVYLLLAALVRHAVLVERGDATLGWGMVSPGAAAAIAADALPWLQPSALRRVAEAAVSQQQLAVPLLQRPGASSSGGLLRALLGVHPAQLVPPAAALVCALSAAVAFLASYWATVQEGQMVFGEVRTALRGSGLLQAVGRAAGPLPQAQLHVPGPLPGGSRPAPADELAMALLHQPPVLGAGAGLGSAQASTIIIGRSNTGSVGAALASWALRQVEAGSAAPQAASGTGPGLTRPHDLWPARLALRCMQVGADAGACGRAGSVVQGACGGATAPLFLQAYAPERVAPAVVAAAKGLKADARPPPARTSSYPSPPGLTSRPRQRPCCTPHCGWLRPSIAAGPTPPASRPTPGRWHAACCCKSPRP